MSILNTLRSGLFLCLCTLIYAASYAQPVPTSLMKSMKARSIGPAGMSGRVTAIDGVTGPNGVIYAGTASGGLWKSESEGVDWEPVFDKEKVMSIGAVAIQPGNTSVIWVGTGEGNPRNSLNGGYGVYRSLDAGKSWQLMGLEETRHVHRIVIDPTDPNTVYVGAIGSPWGEHPQRGVYRTKDGGKTWEHVLKVDVKTGAADLIIDPNNPNKLIAAMWEHRRKPWTFNSGGPGSGLFITVDGGDTWKKLSDKDGLPKGDLGRIGLAIAPSNSKRVYALIESKKNALYRSDNGGFNWYKVNDKSEIGNRPFYYSDLFVDPANENRLYSLFTYVNVSDDGGKSFRQLMPAYGTSRGVHPDHHAWWIDPTNANFMINGNDGGLNITRDRGRTWRFVENLPLAQFYHINVDMEYPYNVYGGMQDNGSWAGPAYVWKSQGIRNSYWQELSFGDGFDVVPDPDDSRYGYSMSQQGFVVAYDRVTGSQRMMRPTHPEADTLLRFNWNSAIAQDPHDNNTIYFGSQYVHKSTDKGFTWEIISPDLTTNNPDKQKQGESGGLTMDATGAENNTTILAIAPSKLEKDVLWIGTDDGLVQISRDGGKNWQKLSIPGMPAESWVAQITPSSYNAGEAFVIVNNYRNYDYKPYLFRTTDYGATWTSMVNESQVWTYTLSFVQDPVSPNLMFLGTDGGLYVTIDGGQNWTQWDQGFPHVSTMDLVIHPREHDLVIGTFGRAAYVLDDIRPLRKLAADGISILNRDLVVFDPPVGYQSLNQQPSGTRFGGDAIYNGENRRRGAMITYYVNNPAEEKKPADEEEDKKKKKKKKSEEAEAATTDSTKVEVNADTLFVEFFKGEELIRTLKQKKPDTTGIYRMYWGMDEKGADYPSRNTPRRRSEPGGVSVLPGEYKVRMTIGEVKDSTMITVQFDPRVNVSAATLQAQYTRGKELESYRQVAADAMTRLRNSMEVAKAYESQMKKLDKDGFKESIDLSKAMQDSIKLLMVPIVGKERGSRQGIVRDPRDIPVTSRIGNASYYMNSSLEAPGATEERLRQQAKTQIDQIVKDVNAFYEGPWEEYKKAMESVELNPFKEYDPLEID